MKNIKKKDIAILCQYFYPEKITSAKLPFMTAEKLVKDNFTVDVICGTPSKYIGQNVLAPKIEEKNGIFIKRLPYLKFKSKKSIFRIINFISLVLSFSFQIPNLKQYKIIIVYSNPPILPIIAIIAKKLFNIKFVFVSYDVYPEIAINTKQISSDGIIAKLMFYLNDYIFKYVDKVVTLSNEMKTFILDNRNFSEVNVEVIPNWSTEDISKVPIKEIENNKFLISYFGNIGIAQDFDSIKFALKYFTGNPIIQWSFAGHGTYYNDLIDYTITNNIDNVTFNGYLNQEELNRLASISNCFLLSLKKELAGLAVPSKYYTYLNYNKPIIAIISKKTDIFKEINQYKLGVAIKNEDKNCLVQTIEKLSKSYSNFNNLYVYKEFYEPDVQLLKYSQMIKSLIRDIE